jgi:hypothetical protein
MQESMSGITNAHFDLLAASRDVSAFSGRVKLDN